MEQFENDADLLFGAKAIAAFLKVTERQVYNLHSTTELPTFKLGAIVCARRSTIREFFAAQERCAAPVAAD